MDRDEMLQSDKEKLEAFMKDFGRFVNSGISHSIKQPAMVEILNREHNTLQGNIVRTVLQIIAGMTSDDLRTDGRNEHAKKQYQMMIEGFGIVAAQSEYDRVLMDTSDKEFVQRRKDEFLENFKKNPATYLGIAYI